MIFGIKGKLRQDSFDFELAKIALPCQRLEPSRYTYFLATLGSSERESVNCFLIFLFTYDGWLWLDHRTLGNLWYGKFRQPFVNRLSVKHRKFYTFQYLAYNWGLSLSFIVFVFCWWYLSVRVKPSSFRTAEKAVGLVGLKRCFS